MILSIDPGKATGVATYDADHGGFDSYEIEGRYALAGHVSDNSWDEVVCEDFVISQRTIKTTPQKGPLRIIGWLDIWCEELKIPFTLQTAGQGHANDAARHLLVYLVAKYPQQAMKLLEGLDLS